jgi:twinkle protein
MKIQSTITRKIYEFDSKNSTYEERHQCPECSSFRKNKKEKCFAWDNVQKRGYCHNCNSAFFEYKPYAKEKEYFIPEWKNITDLSDKAVKWFTGRKISQNTLNKMQIYTDKEFMPQFNKEIEVICYPYFLDEKLVNIKFRGANKTFKLVKGSERIFYNIDSMKDMDYVIICEGENDCLSFIECGFDSCISVPNGAGNNIEYLDNYINYFENKNKIYIAVDQDSKGLELRDELIRRLGFERCFTINFKDCKDANEYLIKYANLEFKELLKNCDSVSVKGIVYVKSLYNEIKLFYDQGIQRGLEININTIDKYISWELRRLAIVTGIPGSGKSEFVDYIISKLNILYGWKVAYFTPENYPLNYHYAKIFEKIIGKKFHKEKSSEYEFDMAIEYINDNYYYILDEENFTLDAILKAAKSLIRHRGIKILVIDPYNKIDHQIRENISETTYINEFLDKLTLFCRLNNILIFLIAHPRKMNKGDVPSLYDVAGSAHFYNKCDYGFTVHRIVNENNIMQNEIDVYWQKIKFKHLGEQGISNLVYNYTNGRFEEKTTGGVNNWDNSNWLLPKEIVLKNEWYEKTDEIEDAF